MTEKSLTKLPETIKEKIQFENNKLSFNGSVSIQEWMTIGDFLKRSNHAVKWWIGDWLNYGELAYGEKYSQALTQTDFVYGTLANCKYVAERVEFSLRNENLSWNHHALVASKHPTVIKRWLDYAEKNGLSVDRFRHVLKSGKIEDYESGKENLDSWFHDWALYRADLGLKALTFCLRKLQGAGHDRETARLIIEQRLEALKQVVREYEGALRGWDKER